jgi:toxin ParE1/3/4
MALSVRFHPAARAQLFDLYEYIAAETGRDRAGGFIDRIKASCLSLGTFPEMGRKAEDLGPDLRLHPFERRAMIVYRVTPEAVEVLGFYCPSCFNQSSAIPSASPVEECSPPQPRAAVHAIVVGAQLRPHKKDRDHRRSEDNPLPPLLHPKMPRRRHLAPARSATYSGHP